MKKMDLMAATLIGMVMIGGCANTKFLAHKDGITQEEFRKDDYECRLQSRTYGGGGGTGLMGIVMMGIAMSTAQSQANKIYKECMEIRGYTITIKEVEKPKEETSTVKTFDIQTDDPYRKK